MYGLQKILDKTPKKQQQHQTKNHHQKKTPNKQKTKPKESTFLKRYYCDLWCRRVILYKGYLNNAWITEKKNYCNIYNHTYRFFTKNIEFNIKSDKTVLLNCNGTYT